MDFFESFESHLSEDDIITVASHLPLPSILALASTSRALHLAILTSRQLWRSLSISILGEPLVGLHAAAWRYADTARFHRRLVRAAHSCSGLAYANGLRRMVTHSFSEAHLKRIICTTGHTASACGPSLVAVIGGWRSDCSLEHLHVYIVDIAHRSLRVPELHETSSKPARRMRHAAAVVSTPPWALHNLPAGSPAETLPSVLVLGGACDGGPPGADPPIGQERGEPVAGGLLALTLLSFCTNDGSVVQWQECEASGTAPAAGMWHHTAVPFCRGERVCVFGGDVPRDDPEFEQIRCSCRPPAQLPRHSSSAVATHNLSLCAPCPRSRPSVLAILSSCQQSARGESGLCARRRRAPVGSHPHLRPRAFVAIPPRRPRLPATDAHGGGERGRPYARARWE